ncbi:hypothetical protein F9K97_25095, partial [Brucella anthropi]
MSSRLSQASHPDCRAIDKRLTTRLAAAKLRFPEACVEDIDFRAARNLDRRATMALAQG